MVYPVSIKFEYVCAISAHYSISFTPKQGRKGRTTLKPLHMNLVKMATGLLECEFTSTSLVT